MERPVPLFGILRPGGGGAGGGAGGNLRYSTLLEFSVLFTLGQVWQTWLFRWLKKKQNPKKKTSRTTGIVRAHRSPPVGDPDDILHQFTALKASRRRRI